jgi:hypothetical protein
VDNPHEIHLFYNNNHSMNKNNMMLGVIFFMKRTLMLTISILLLIPSLFVYAKNINENSMKDFVLVFLDESMHQAVNKYYGEPRMYDLYNAKILEMKPLKKGERFSSEIKVQVLTYKGPHNPPYGIETITLISDFTNIKVVKYEHMNPLTNMLTNNRKNNTENLYPKPYQYEYPYETT